MFPRIQCYHEETKMFAQGTICLYEIMQRVKAEILTTVCSLLGQAYMHVETGADPGSESWGIIASHLGQLERTCEELGFLPSTLSQVRKVKPHFMKNGKQIHWPSFSRDLRLSLNV